MTGRDDELTVTGIIATATNVLETEGAYRRVDLASIWKEARGIDRLFEDRFGIVALAVRASWRELVSEWSQVQGELMQIMARYVPRDDSRAWDGYLVLMSPDSGGTEVHLESSRIRQDTRHVRKLVASGVDLRASKDVRQILLPLLPLREALPGERPESLLGELSGTLARQGRSDAAVRAVTTVADADRQGNELFEAIRRELERER